MARRHGVRPEGARRFAVLGVVLGLVAAERAGAQPTAPAPGEAPAERPPAAADEDPGEEPPAPPERTPPADDPPEAGPGGESESPPPTPERPRPPPAVPGAPGGLPYRLPKRVEPPAPPPTTRSPAPATESAPAPGGPPPAVPGAPAGPAPTKARGPVEPSAAPPAQARDAGKKEAADDDGATEYSHEGLYGLVSATAGMSFNGRFGGAPGSESSDSADTLFGGGLSLELDGRWAFGLAYSRAGYGKERFTPGPDGSSLDVAYELDELWATGRYYPSPARPSVYLGLGLGAAVTRARAIGTSTDAPSVAAGVPFSCSDAGGVAPGALLAAGASFDLSSALSFESEVQAAGHYASDAPDAHGRCGQGQGVAVPGAGVSLRAGLRVGLAYRLPL